MASVHNAGIREGYLCADLIEKVLFQWLKLFITEEVFVGSSSFQTLKNNTLLKKSKNCSEQYDFDNI